MRRQRRARKVSNQSGHNLHPLDGPPWRVLRILSMGRSEKHNVDTLKTKEELLTGSSLEMQVNIILALGDAKSIDT